MPVAGTAQIDPVDVYLADLSTGEIIESLSGGPDIGLMLIEADAEEIIDDDSDQVIVEETLRFKYDAKNPRTEIEIEEI